MTMPNLPWACDGLFPAVIIGIVWLRLYCEPQVSPVIYALRKHIL